MKKSRQNEGFTLIELMVCLAIISLSLVLVLPFSTPGTAWQSLDATADSIIGELRIAQMRALMRNEPQTVSFNLETRTIQAEGGATIDIPRQISVKLLTAQGEIRGQMAGYRFFPDGAATGGEIELSDGTYRRIIVINWLTGEAQQKDALSQ